MKRNTTMNTMNGKATVSSIVLLVLRRIANGVIAHVSEIKRAVWRIKPDANETTISTALFNLRRFGLATRPRPYFYQWQPP